MAATSHGESQSDLGTSRGAVVKMAPAVDCGYDQNFIWMASFPLPSSCVNDEMLYVRVESAHLGKYYSDSAQASTPDSANWVEIGRSRPSLNVEASGKLEDDTISKCTNDLEEAYRAQHNLLNDITVQTHVDITAAKHNLGLNSELTR